jgi:hypothetical protein
MRLPEINKYAEIEQVNRKATISQEDNDETFITQKGSKIIQEKVLYSTIINKKECCIKGPESKEYTSSQEKERIRGN